MALVWLYTSLFPYEMRIDQAVCYYEQTRGRLPSAVLIRPDEVEDADLLEVRGTAVLPSERSMPLHFLLLDENESHL